jgi:hypothetical protein
MAEAIACFGAALGFIGLVAKNPDWAILGGLIFLGGLLWAAGDNKH